jgi:hypothetical protein
MKITKAAAALIPGDEAFLIGNWRRVAAVQDRGGLIVVDTTDGCRVSLPAEHPVRLASCGGRAQAGPRASG